MPTIDKSTSITLADRAEATTGDALQSMDDKLLEKLFEVVKKNLNNEQFSVEDLADEIAFSRSHLHRKLQSLTGQSISQFIRKIRLDHGIMLLKSNVGTVSEVAFKVGFGSSTYFIKCFHEQFGFSPGEVKKKVAEGWFDQEAPSTEDPTISEDLKDVKTGIQPAIQSTPLEALHPSSSEQLILEIFNEMVKYKPTLGKFLIIDEEEGESLDIRLLAYQIIKNYPWPIGVEIRRLFSASLREPGRDRYNQLQKTILRTNKLIAYILTCELCVLMHEQIITIDKNESDIIRKAYNDLTPVNLVALLKALHGALDGSSEKRFVAELNPIINPAFFLELDDWVTMSENTEQNLSESCTALEQTLMLLLKKSAFLVGYKMVNVGTIVVNKSKFKNASFEHHFHLLNSSDPEFKIHHEILEQFSDSNSILLMKSIKDAKQFLNLSPLVIDTHREELNNTIKSAIKRDVYLFESFENEEIKYSGTGVTTSNDLSSLDNYHSLVEEFKAMLNLMTK